MTNKRSPTTEILQDTKNPAELSCEMRIKQLAALAKGISHPVRIEIVRMLAQKPKDKRCVCGDIVGSFSLAQSSISQHLKVLRDAGWIHGEIDGPRVCYCLVEDIIEYYTALIEQCLNKN